MRAEREESHQTPPSPASIFIMTFPTGHKESLTVQDLELWIRGFLEKPHPESEALQPVRRVRHALSGSTKLFLLRHPGRGPALLLQLCPDCLHQVAVLPLASTLPLQGQLSREGGINSTVHSYRQLQSSSRPAEQLHIILHSFLFSHTSIYVCFRT